MWCKHIGVARLSGLLMLAMACEDARDAGTLTSQAERPTTDRGSHHALEVYPRARWRLARERLPRVLLNISHIAIRHRDSGQEVPWLRSPGWHPDLPATRSRAEAIERAFVLADQVKQAPGRFAALARQHSDDLVTAQWGGALGLIQASALPDAVLDAIATLAPGHVSRPVETDYGIHILKLGAPPKAHQLAGARILVGYRPSSLAVERPGHAVTRSRQEAYALAAELVRQAREAGADFGALVERYSDATDATQRGDLGIWSTHEPTRWPLVFEALAAMPLFGVTDPVDTGEGLQIVMRMPVTVRERFSMDYVLVGSLGNSEAELQSEIDDVVTAVTADPAKFDLFRSERCCSEPWTWSRGRGPGPEVERVLRESAIGSVVLTPIETAAGFYLVKKREPPLEQPLSPLLKLPAPRVANLHRILQNAEGALLARPLRLAARQIAALPFEQQKRERLEQLVVSVARDLPSAMPEKRPQLLRDFWQRAHGFLSPDEVQQVRGRIAAFTTWYLMNH